MLPSKIKAIREYCTPLIGHRIERFETAEILHADGTWEAWPDLPIRIYCCDKNLISVAWSQVDELWLSNDETLPFPVEDTTTRWQINQHAKLDGALGKLICGVSIGRGQMAIEGTEIEIWTRLLFELDTGWLEVFNALDENGYELHLSLPYGDYQKCI